MQKLKPTPGTTDDDAADGMRCAAVVPSHRDRCEAGARPEEFTGSGHCFRRRSPLRSYQARRDHLCACPPCRLCRPPSPTRTPPHTAPHRQITPYQEYEHFAWGRLLPRRARVSRVLATLLAASTMLRVWTRKPKQTSTRWRPTWKMNRTRGSEGDQTRGTVGQSTSPRQMRAPMPPWPGTIRMAGIFPTVYIRRPRNISEFD